MTAAVPHFVWYELTTPDPKAAAAFYAEVVGWTAEDNGAPGMDYTVFSAGPARIGGAMALTEDMRAMGVPPCWTGYIGVPDVDAHVQTLAAAGGHVMRPASDIPGIGRFAVVTDPHGAVFILFRGDGDMGPQAEPGSPGTVGWHELMAGDVSSAWPFYAALFGWTDFSALDMGSFGTYQTFAAGTLGQIGGMMTRPQGAPGPFWRYYFIVAALDAAIARLTAMGGQVTLGPMQVPGGQWMVQAADSQGALFALLAPQR